MGFGTDLPSELVILGIVFVIFVIGTFASLKILSTPSEEPQQIEPSETY
jgi:hypothetical protein